MVKSESARPSVVFFHRKPRNVGNYSVEFIFDDVRNRLKQKINATIVVSRYESSGLFKRLAACIEAWRKQGQVNHITGDVNYLGLLLNKRKTINTILDCVHLNTTSGFKYIILKWFWLSIPEKRARFLTAISESTKQEILKHHPCNPDKIVVIPVAISPSFTYKEKAFEKACPRILQVGTAPNKNIPNLIEAIKGLSCILHIVGKRNPLYEELLRKNQVKYVYESNLSNEEIIDRYEKADIISLVSTYEGFGMPILEAQAVGRPVITSNLYSMPEVAGDSAVIVDPHDIAAIRKGIERIIQDDSFREDRIRRGLENIKRFDPDVIANQYYNLYKKIADENRKA
jgi:glycosyltransferase involved in cell wall biosynthesis